MVEGSLFSTLARACALLAMPLALVGAVPAGKLAVGGMAPDAELTLMDGSKVTLAQLRGQVVVLNFWATWCVPCRQELPLLDTYYRIQKKAGLHVYAVTTEDSLPLYRMKPLFAKLTIESARRMKGPYAPIGNAVPTSYIIDRAGRIRYAKAGALTLDVLNQQLVPLLNERVAMQ